MVRHTYSVSLIFFILAVVNYTCCQKSLSEINDCLNHAGNDMDKTRPCHMRLSVAFLVALALVRAAKGNNGGEAGQSSVELLDTLAEFKSLLPEEEFNLIFLKYLYTDSEFQETVNYVQTNEFKDFLRKVNEIEDVRKLYDYLVEAGFDAYAVMNSLFDSFDMPHMTPRRGRRSNNDIGITGGMDGYITDMRAILPTDKIKALHQEKLKSSPAFARFVEYLKAPRFQELIDALHANEEYQRLLNLAKQGGIDVRAIAKFAISMWGLELPMNRVERSTPELPADFREFHALVDKDEFSEIRRVARLASSTNELTKDLIEFGALLPNADKIIEEYLENDVAFAAAFAYARSDAFRDLVGKFNSIDDVINFYDYLEEAGLDIYVMLNRLNGATGLPPVEPKRNPRSAEEISAGQRQSAGFIADFKARLPIDKIKALHNEKLKTSPAFARFVEYLESPRFEKLVHALRNNVEVQKLLQTAKEGGIDAYAIVDLYLTALGLEYLAKN